MEDNIIPFPTRPRDEATAWLTVPVIPKNAVVDPVVQEIVEAGGSDNDLKLGYALRLLAERVVED